MKIRMLAVSLVAAALLPTVTLAQEVTLKVAHFLPPLAAAHREFIVPWCDKIAADSQNRIQCQLYPAMQLGGTPPQLLNQVRDGVADVIWTLPGYTAGRFPVSEVFELPFITGDPIASSKAFWDFVQANASRELAGVKPIALWVNGPNVMHFRDKKVENLADLQGLKIRAPSRLGNQLLEALGAVPVGMPVPQLAESLSRGVIEGALIPWEVVPATKTQELTQYHAEQSGERAMTTATMIFVMNQRKYDSLPDDLKQVIDNNSGRETSAWVASVFRKANEAGRQAALDHGNTIYPIAPEEMARWQEATQPVTTRWIQEITDKGLNGQQLYDDARKLIEQYSAQ